MSATIKFIQQLIFILSGSTSRPPNDCVATVPVLRTGCGRVWIRGPDVRLLCPGFTAHEESISENRTQLQAVALIIGTQQGAEFSGSDYQGCTAWSQAFKETPSVHCGETCEPHVMARSIPSRCRSREANTARRNQGKRGRCQL